MVMLRDSAPVQRIMKLLCMQSLLLTMRRRDAIATASIELIEGRFTIKLLCVQGLLLTVRRRNVIAAASVESIEGGEIANE